MRILLVVHAFPPRSTAGVEVYTLRLAQALGGRGHEVQVLTAVHDLAVPPYTTRRRRYAGVDVVEIVSVHHHGTLERTYADPEIDRAAEAVLRELRPDCVHVQHVLNLSTGLLAAARAQGARVAFTLHDYWLTCARDGLRMREDGALCSTVEPATCARCFASSPYLVPPLQRGVAGLARAAGAGRYLHRVHAWAPRLVEGALGLVRRVSPPEPAVLASAFAGRAEALRRAAAEVDVFLAPTAFARYRAFEAGVPADRVEVLPLGVLRMPPQSRAAGRRRRFGFVGTVAPHKGVHVLIEAFRALQDPDVCLEVHGSLSTQPSYADSVRTAAAGDPRIRFHGPFEEGRQREVFAGFDVLVLPSVWWENSPMVVLEALGAGLPVVASRIGGVPELVREGAGRLVPPGDAGALQATLADVASGRLLSEPHSALDLKTIDEEAAVLEARYRRD